ncbi:MAG: cyclodeaminase/cyclohydrolase family protein [Chloroflexi bacterium]|nr:cyclodeaminase/cyclohydrolase family protein [Chloroflexota bacterium]
MFTEKTINQFLDELASKAPVPGGGSAAALGGALAAALLSMVCNLTIGKKGYEDVESDMKALLSESEALRARFPLLLERDTQVYSQVMDAYRLPKDTPEQKAAKEKAMQTALVAAAEVPLEIAAGCARVVELAMTAAQKGNKWAVSDAGVAVVLAEAAMRGALLNVEINLASITDREYVRKTRARMDEITAGKAELKERVMDVVLQSIRG